MADDIKRKLSRFDSPAGGLHDSFQQNIIQFSAPEVQLQNRHSLLIDKATAATDPKERAAAMAAADRVLDQLVHASKPRLEQAGSKYYSGIRTLTGTRETNSYLSSESNNPSYFSQQLSMARTQSTAQIQGGLDVKARQLQINTEAIHKATREHEDPAKINELALQRGGLLDDMAAGRGALKEQRRLGLDTRSVYNQAFDKVSRVMRDQEESGIRAGARAGNAGTFEDSQKALAAASKELIEAFKQMTAATEQAADKTEASANAAAAAEAKYKEVAKDFDTKSIQSDELKRRGDSRGDGLARGGQAFGATLEAAGAIYSQWTVQRKLESASVNTSLQNIANRRFDDSRSAASGDLFALQRIEDSQKAMGLGTSIAKDSRAATELDTSGKVVGGIAGVGGSLMKGDVAGAFTGGSSAAVGVSGNTARLTNGAVDAQGFLQGQAAQEGLSAAESYRRTTLKQIAFDQMSTAYASTAGAGLGRNALTNRINSKEFMGKAAGLWMTPEEIAQGTTAGIALNGKNFSENDLLEGQKLVNKGVVRSTAEYSSLKSQVLGGQGNESNLKSIMADAMRIGIEGAKNIGDMTNAISGLAEKGGIGGISMYSGVQATTMATMEALMGKKGMTASVATSSAANLVNAFDAAATDQSASISNMISVARIQKRFGVGMNTSLGQRLQNASPTQISAAMAAYKLNDSDRDDKLSELGFLNFTKGKTKEQAMADFKELQRIKGDNALQNLTKSGIALDTKSNSRLQELAGKEKLTKEERREGQNIFSQFRGSENLPFQDFSGMRAGLFGYVDPVSRKKDAGATDGNETAKNAEERKRINAEAKKKELDEGNKLLTPGAMSDIFTKMSGAMSGIDPEAYSKLNTSTGDLSKVVDALRQTVSDLNLKLGGKPLKPAAPSADVEKNKKKEQPFVIGAPSYTQSR